MSDQSPILDVNGRPHPLVLVTPIESGYPRQDQLGDLLYFHLVCARTSGERLDRMSTWDAEYELEFGARRSAIQRARATLRELTDAGHPIPQDLLPMAIHEGLA